MRKKGELLTLEGMTFAVTRSFKPSSAQLSRQPKTVCQHSLTGEDLQRYSVLELADGDLVDLQSLELPAHEEYHHFPSSLRLFMAKKKQSSSAVVENNGETPKVQKQGDSWLLQRLINHAVLSSFPAGEDRKSARTAMKDVNSWGEFVGAMEQAGVTGPAFTNIMDGFFDHVRK